MRRRLLAAVPAIALSLVVSACGDGASRAPFAESRTPPALTARFYPPQGWAWGYIQSGDGPVQRYGVTAPPVSSRGTILILTGYGETAEKWFETVSALTRRGFTVWVLERQGQGGSERLTPWRDLGHIDSFDPDVAVVKALVNTVIRPKGGARFVVLGHGEGGLVALRAAQTGLPMDALLLSSPAFDLSALPRPRSDFARFTPALRTLRLGWIRSSDQRGWRRDGLDGKAAGLTHDADRGKVQAAWMLANPDLRMGGRSLGWFAAFFDASEAAARDIGKATVPVLMLNAGRDRVVTAKAQTRLCRDMKACREIRYAGGAHDLHMESDAVRVPWLTEVAKFAAPDAPPKPSPTKDQGHGL
ncbi:alpha/beta hydrolase [Caulobacter sp. SL161]|uniref:alpha/beta fold hydrolase n=1 Tax=Caulobacter sp. SL161 TaxID=2995156 RepID=UPI0022756BDD|nr:alpha/beta hydrolase [Caulobacter sp. SL161]MCY1647734.1 alpha/beta hydrolase [Caulobacter sp. SL161]